MHVRRFTFNSGLLLLALAACSDSDSDKSSDNEQTAGSTGGSASTGAGGSGAAGSAGSSGASGASGSSGSGAPSSMSFFVTSRGSGNGGNFGGIAGADAFCKTLATAANAALGNKTWRAYLSTSTENARDRIGAGPWRNFAGKIIANNLADLHDQAAGGASESGYPLGDINTPLDETGATVPSAQPTVFHDIITGSNLDGTVSASGTCSDWTSTTGTTRNGHSNRGGGGQNPTSWNSAHDTGCGEPAAGMNFQQGTVSQGGGRGSIYCFATD